MDRRCKVHKLTERLKAPFRTFSFSLIFRLFVVTIDYHFALYKLN